MEIKKKRFIRPEVTVMDVQTQSLLAGSDPEMVSGAKAEGFTRRDFIWDDATLGD